MKNESTITTINQKALDIRRANHGISACSKVLVQISLHMCGDRSTEDEDFQELISTYNVEGLCDAITQLTYHIAGYAEWIEDQTMGQKTDNS